MVLALNLRRIHLLWPMTCTTLARANQAWDLWLVLTRR
jgi:hypothetical protein